MTFDPARFSDKLARVADEGRRIAGVVGNGIHVLPQGFRNSTTARRLHRPWVGPCRHCAGPVFENYLQARPAFEFMLHRSGFRASVPRFDPNPADEAAEHLGSEVRFAVTSPDHRISRLIRSQAVVDQCRRRLLAHR
jgi:hypothetical protein